MWSMRLRHRPVQIILDNRGWMQAYIKQSRQAITRYLSQIWHTFTIEIDCQAGHYSLLFDGEPIVIEEALIEKVNTVERIVFRTGQYRPAPKPQPTYLSSAPDLPHGGSSVKEAVYWLDDVELTGLN